MALRLFLFLSFCSFGWAVSEAPSTEQGKVAADPIPDEMRKGAVSEGHLQFLLQQGQADTVVRLTQNADQPPLSPTLLRSLALALLKQGIHERDPETQLLALFGAAFSCNEHAYEILAIGLQSPFLPMQLLAVQGIARLQSDRSEALLVKAMGSPFPLVRLEALELLADLQNPLTLSLAEALFWKAPRPLLLFYPPILAKMGTKPATMKLRRFLSDPSLDMRVAALLHIHALAREDLLPCVRSKLLSASLPEQEAAAFVVGSLGDNRLVAPLQTLSSSKDVFVRLSAANALLSLGEEKAFQVIQSEVEQKNCYAISLLSQWQDPLSHLPPLMQDKDPSVRLNACIASLQMGSPIPLSFCREVLLQDPKQTLLTSQPSPGTCLVSFALTPTYTIPSALLPAALEHDSKIKERIMTHLHGQDRTAFFSVADALVQARREELLPSLMTLLQEDGSPQALGWLSRHAEALGAPFIRNFCLLTLYRIQKKQEWGKMLREWAKEKNQTFFLQLEQKGSKKERYLLTPEQTSGLLIQIFETFAAERDPEGIQVLLEAIASGHPKNRYVLAGLLLRATE